MQSCEGSNTNWMSVLCFFKMVYLMSVFSDKIVNKRKTVLPLRLLFPMFDRSF